MARNNGKVMKLWNPGPSLMVAGNTGQHRLKVIGQNPKPRRRRTTSNPSSKQAVDLIVAGLFALVGGMAAEVVGGYIVSPVWKIAGKAGVGLMMAFGGQYIPIKIVQTNAGYAGAGAVASAGGDAIVMFRNRNSNANMFLRPVRLSPGETMLPQGAVLPNDVLKAAQSGNLAAQRLIVDIRSMVPDGNLGDIVWVPASPTLSDIVYKQNLTKLAA